MFIVFRGLIVITGQYRTGSKQRFKCTQNTHVWFTALGFPDAEKYAAGAGTTFYFAGEKNDRYRVIFTDEKRIKEAPATPTNPPLQYKTVTVKQIYEIEKGKLDSDTYRMRWGLAYGALVVPFKFRTHDKSLTGESTLGYYLGVKNDWLLASGTTFISAGLTLIPITDVNSGETENKTGFSWAIGYAFASKEDFQAAILLGRDHLGGSTGDAWEYEDDTWLSVAISFGFMN